jgi:type I restriction enzyme S subunit
LFEITQGKALSRKKDKGISPYPFLRTSNVYWGRIDLSTVDKMDFTEEEVEKYAMAPDDLLVCEGGDIGRTAIWELNRGPYCYRNHLHRLRPRGKGVYPLFYMYWMQAALLILNLYQGIANRTTIANLSQSRLSRFLLPKPPLPEQRRIASALRTIQKAIAAQEDVIAAARELKRSLMERLFTYGPGTQGSPTKTTEIGQMPEYWEVTRLEKIVQKPQYGYTQSAKETPVGPKFLRITDITESGIDWATVPYCECEDDDLKEYRLAKGDILFARTGATTGKSHLVDQDPADAVFASYLIRVRANEAVVPAYLYAFFNTEAYWRQIGQRKRGSAQAGVSATRLSDLMVPLAPQQEQEQIASALLAVMGKTAAEERRQAALKELFSSTLKQLMTGTTRLVQAGT